MPAREVQAGDPGTAGERRRIAHLDMDAFFASVELLRYPELRGQAVVVGGRGQPPQQMEDGSYRYRRLRDYVGRGVLTTSTYEARQYGVFSAMGIMKAAQLAPDAILLPADFLAYREYSRRFKLAVAAVADRIEDRGIDEIYIDLTGHPEPDDRILAQQIKQAVRDATGLSCSIAVTPNKLLSKIGSDLDKPDGLTLLSMQDVPTRIWPLAVSKVNGIGPKATARLQAMGIQTIGQLARAEAALLQEQFGQTYTAWLLRVAQGRDERPVVTHSEPKSVSRETTFERDLHVVRDRGELSRVLVQLCERVSQDLQRKQCRGRTIGVKLRFEDFRTVTRDHTVPFPTDEPAVILDAARQCLKRIPMHGRIRLLGIRVGKLGPLDGDAAPGAGGEQLSLY